MQHLVYNCSNNRQRKRENLPKRTAANLSCASGYFGKNLYSSNRFEIMQLKIATSLLDNNISETKHQLENKQNRQSSTFKKGVRGVGGGEGHKMQDIVSRKLFAQRKKNLNNSKGATAATCPLIGSGISNSRHSCQ
jgi:signal transduction histidine kinase